jgi:6-phosphogluconolactonase
VLPHYPHGTKEGDGFIVAKWVGDGRLDMLKTIPCENPAFMKYHPHLNVLYVLSECIDKNGYLTAYKVDPFTANVTELGRITMTGKSTCYISFDKGAKHAIITNYWDGLINVVELNAQGTPVRIVQEHQQTRRDTWRQVQDRADHMANRQDGPHAHCNVFHPSYQWVFVPDLGDNSIHQYAYDSGRLTPQTHIQLPPGEGPRHFVFHPTLPVAYSGCELLSRVQVFAVDDSNPEEVKARISPMQSFPTLPDGFTSRNYVGEIKIDRMGRFVYVSNRGHHSIAVFAVDQSTGLLTPVSIDSTLGKTPRHFGLSPCGGFCVVGDQDDDVVKVFKVCSDTGRLEFIPGAEYQVPTPNFVLFQQPYPMPRLDVGIGSSPLAAEVPATTAAAEEKIAHQEELLVSPTTMVACS